MFQGLSAFPLTPMNEQGLDEAAFAGLVERLADARVDSIGALGSTGCYTYLQRAERKRVLQLAVEHAGAVPVLAGIGSLRTRDVLWLAEDAQQVGARAVLLAPVSYQVLSEEEVFSLYQSVSRSLSVPLVVYDNPITTRFTFSDELHGRIAELPNVAAIKIPAVPNDPQQARARVEALRGLLPDGVALGVSGDASAATGLNAGCELWFSVIGGLFPELALAIVRAAASGQAPLAEQLSHEQAVLWDCYSRYGGSLRVAATLAELCGHVQSPCLPQPLMSLQGEARERLAAWLAEQQLSH